PSAVPRPRSTVSSVLRPWPAPTPDTWPIAAESCPPATPSSLSIPSEPPQKLAPPFRTSHLQRLTATSTTPLAPPFSKSPPVPAIVLRSTSPCPAHPTPHPATSSAPFLRGSPPGNQTIPAPHSSVRTETPPALPPASPRATPHRGPLSRALHCNPPCSSSRPAACAWSQWPRAPCPDQSSPGSFATPHPTHAACL